MKKEKIKDKEFTMDFVPMAVSFWSERLLTESRIGLDQKIQILSLDSTIESWNDRIKKISQKDLQRFLRCSMAPSIILKSKPSRIDGV